MPELVEDHIKNIQTKLQLLLKKLVSAQKDNVRLVKENSTYQENQKQMEERIQILEQQVNILKTSSGKLEGKDKKDFEKVINQYIKSIEKCISTLNN